MTLTSVENFVIYYSAVKRVWGTPLLGLLFYPETQVLFFPNLHIQHAEAQHMIRLLMTSSVSCLFINWSIWDMPHLFSPGVIKIYNLPVLDAASKQQTLAGEIRSSVPDTSSPPLPFTYHLFMLSLNNLFSWLTSLNPLLFHLDYLGMFFVMA